MSVSRPSASSVGSTSSQLESSSSWVSPSSEIWTWTALPSSLIMSGRWVSYQVTTDVVGPSGIAGHDVLDGGAELRRSAARSSLE